MATPIPGPRKKVGEWEKLEEIFDFPTYSILHSQDAYQTFSPDSFIMPLFVHIPTREDRFSPNDNYFIVTAVNKDRLDLLSYRFYGSVEYIWVILLANNIVNPFEIPIGTKLRIPSVETLFSNWLNPRTARVL